MNKSLENILQQLGLLEQNAVFFNDKDNGPVYQGFSTEIKQKIDIIKPDAYFVFNSQPLLLFFDLSTQYDQERESDIHKKVWSFDHAPIIFVIKSTEVKVYNAFAYSKNKQGTNEGLEEILLTDQQRKERFSFWNLQSGETWKWLQTEHFEKAIRNKKQKRVNQQLFENIKAVRERFTNTSSNNRLSDDEANTLILRLIFIRYLIDREVKIDEQFITGKTISLRRLCFSKLIESPQKLNQLFDKLNTRFNGVLFKGINISLDETQARGLADVFRGELPERGTIFYGIDHVFFDVFDFSIIPVEVISGIYESLIDPETKELDAAVYTPSFLVEYILQDTVEKYLAENNTSECKIFDPAVGSGIFLVQSLRKMIEKERMLNHKQSNQQFSERIRHIAKSNLFGIDINPQALKVACFSIYIALLDYQDPKDIDQYQFPNLLEENLFEADFFNIEHPFNDEIKIQKPRFILGNPPWKKDKSEKHLYWINNIAKTYSEKKSGAVEIAQSFLLRTKEFMDEATQSVLIVTSTIFYNVTVTAKEFKNELLSTYTVDRFFDLSPVRRLVFEEKNSPASIVYFRLANGSDVLTNVIKHQSIKINHFLKYYKMLVIEKYDQKTIAQHHFIKNDWMFKVALYGNTLDYSFLKRITTDSMERVGSLIDNKTVFGGAGFHKGSSDRYEAFSPLLGKPIIENNQVAKYYSAIDSENKILEQDIYIKSGRNKGLYEGTQLLIKEQAKDETDIVVSLTDKEYAFRSGVFSISSLANPALIKELFAYFVSSLYSYYVYLTCGSWGTSTRPQIRWKEELLSFPFRKLESNRQDEILNLVDQFTKISRDHYSAFNVGKPQYEGILNQINQIINDLYELSPHEQDLIDYVLDVSRYQFQESKQHKSLRKVHTDSDCLLQYASVYIDEFASIYPDEHLQVEVYPSQHFIAMNFVFHKDKPKNGGPVVFPTDKPDEAAILKRLANNLSITKITDATDPSKNLYVQKDIKGFEKDSFYIIKPNEFKCWHRAMAWYDVAEFKEHIERAEIHHLTDNSNALF